MRAVVIHAANDLRIDPLPDRAPDPDEVRIRVGAGGICGSDLHYYHDAGFGAVRLKQPMILGHELAGTIDRVGASVSHLVPGMRVAVNPSRPCMVCRFCRSGMQNQCLDMRFMGSAMRFPHVHGGFSEYAIVDAAQAIPVADTMTIGEAAMAEPLAVCLHAAGRAGSLHAKRVLVTGCGPIGALATLVAHHAGALEVVTTDVVDEPLAFALKVGATRAINVAAEPDALKPFEADKGRFDVLFEASGNQAALKGAFAALRPGAIIVQVGIGGDMTLPMNIVVAKELQLRGAFRFDAEFAKGVEMMGRGLIDVKPLISATLPFERAVEAFDLASDRSSAMKVQLTF